RGLANFFASGVLCLREKLGPFLWQFPPVMPFQADRFEAFCGLLPRDTHELARLAREHDPALAGRVHLDPDARRPLRHAVEFRHESFLTDRFLELCRRYGIALVVADVAGRFPTAQDVTAGWVYVRLHGSRRLYVSGYTPRERGAWAERVRAWARGCEPEDARRIGGPAPRAECGRDVYVFFDNTDVKLRAPADARSLARELGVGPAASPGRVLAELGVRPARPARPTVARTGGAGAGAGRARGGSKQAT
ncbi:MAG TPA: DUF72 domain-containing protein, partial [Phycisphaerales bacterium]|nr:DUF72 domain-containing protein [Phycisphaerales bacterium]